MPRQVYHPNIDTEGNICLNILREDWKPVLSINSVVYGLNFLFLVRLSGQSTPEPWVVLSRLVLCCTSVSYVVYTAPAQACQLPACVRAPVHLCQLQDVLVLL